MFASNFFEEKMLKLLRNEAIAGQSNLYLGLFLSNPSDTGSAGTEINYSGYARQKITFGNPTASGSDMYIQNSADITFPKSLTSAGTVTYVGVFNSASGGDMYLYGELATPLVVQNGISPIFRAGGIKWTWSGNISAYYKNLIMRVLCGDNCPGLTPYIALFNGDPTGSGNEFSGGNYARIPVTMNAPTQDSSGAAISVSSAQISTGIASADWGNLSYIGIMNALTDGNAYAYVQLSSTYNITTNSSVTFDAGQIQFTID